MSIPALLILGAVLMISLATPAARAFEDRSAYVVIDAATGVILAARKPNHPRYPASLTKMMTVLMLFRALDAGTITPETEIPFSETAAAAKPVKLGLPPGASITVADAIPALIARSANDVAVAVAEFLSGTEEAFGQDMTRVAREDLGMTQTTFRNASGLPDDQHISTARDMARLAVTLWRDHADRFPAFGTDTFQFRGHGLPTYNPLITRYDGADGFKTGFTCAAGYNLAGTAIRDGRRVIAVVMGASTSGERYATIKTLMDEGFVRMATDATNQDSEGDHGEAARIVETSSPSTGSGATVLPEPVLPEDTTTAPGTDSTDHFPQLTLANLNMPRPLRGLPAPDVEGCGGGGGYAGGWGITVGAASNRSKAQGMANRVARQYGGHAMTIRVGSGGMVKHSAFVVALSAGQARSICARRQQAGQYCLVRSPKMIWAALQATQRLRR